MKYTCEWTEQKTGASGKTYYEVSLTAEDGTKIPKATTFDQLTAGTAYDGEIVINGKYTNFKKAGDPNIMGARPAWAKKDVSAAVAKAQATTREDVKTAQERTQEAVKMSGSIRDSVLITTAKMRYTEMTDVEIQNELVKWQKVIYNLHEQPFV